MPCILLELGRINQNPHLNTIIQTEVCLNLLQFHSLKAMRHFTYSSPYLQHQVLPKKLEINTWLAWKGLKDASGIRSLPFDHSVIQLLEAQNIICLQFNFPELSVLFPPLPPMFTLSAATELFLGLSHCSMRAAWAMVNYRGNGWSSNRISRFRRVLIATAKASHLLTSIRALTRQGKHF